MRDAVNKMIDDPRTGLPTTDVIMAAYESANQRARVRLPLAEAEFPLLKRSDFNQA